MIKVPGVDRSKNLRASESLANHRRGRSRSYTTSGHELPHVPHTCKWEQVIRNEGAGGTGYTLTKQNYE